MPDGRDGDEPVQLDLDELRQEIRFLICNKSTSSPLVLDVLAHVTYSITERSWDPAMGLYCPTGLPARRLRVLRCLASYDR